MKISWNLENHKKLFLNQNVLDLACHDGDSTFRIKNCGAKNVLGVDIRENLILKAQKQVTDQSVEFFCHDITDYNFLKPLVEKSTVITCFGVLYHLFDHFRFLSQLLKPNIRYCLIETLYGPESPNAEMFWGYEATKISTNGWAEGLDFIPHGTPNLSWIKQSANIFGFDIDFVQKRYVSHDFSKVIDQETNKRMTVRLFNAKMFNNVVPLSLDSIWEWNNDNLIQGTLE